MLNAVWLPFHLSTVQRNWCVVCIVVSMVTVAPRAYHHHHHHHHHPHPPRIPLPPGGTKVLMSKLP